MPSEDGEVTLSQYVIAAAKRRPTYRCAKGHVCVETVQVQVRPFGVFGPRSNEVHTTGPLCPVCYVEWIRANVSAAVQIVETEGSESG